MGDEFTDIYCGESLGPCIKVKVPDSIDSNLTGVDVTAAFSDSKKEVTLGAHPIGEAVRRRLEDRWNDYSDRTPTGIDPEDYETAQSIATVHSDD